jgi:transposase
LVNPYTVKKHREGDQLDRSKDDNRDALTIADLLRTGKFTQTQLLHGQYAELRQYVVLYDRLRQDWRRQKSLIHNLAGQLFPELPRVFKNLSGGTALALLRTQAAAVAVRQLTLETFVAAVRAGFRGQKLQVTKLRQAYDLATISVGLTDGIQALQLALRTHIEILETLQHQLETVQIAVADTFLALPEAPYLLSVPGLKINSSATILAEIGDPSRYSSARQLVKLAGIQPVPNTTGRKSRSRTPMSHKGRPRLRTVLFFAVLRLIWLDEAFAQRYQQLQQRQKNPLSKMQAIGVLMNKLLRILWALMSQQSFYDPAAW